MHNSKNGLNLFNLINELANQIQNEIRRTCTEQGLQLVHAQILFYLSKCNRFSDTLASVTDYLGITKGTVSQSIILLEKKGLLTKRYDNLDRRIQHVLISSKGDEILMKLFPPKNFIGALQKLTENQKENLEKTILEICNELTCSSQSIVFGSCHNCNFLKSDGKFYQCAFARQPIIEKDLEKLCRAFSPKKSHPQVD